ncbi:UNVERIFIED_CONTAM: hypothetical protein Scaly_2805100 [Sesamum calycinum]|uniref:Uncharacterized protein n=1 Tax=Sesamum calycinum TaxID=2727403 RepID=A0AAW2IUQ6_9LAMI
MEFIGNVMEMIGNLYAGKLMFDIHPRIAYNLADQHFSRVLTLHQDFKRKDLMKEENRPYSITYRIAYVISNTYHSDLFLRKEYIEIPRIFKEFAKATAPDPIMIPRIGGINIVIKDHLVLDRTLSSRTEFSSRMSFSKDRIMGYKGKEKELLRALTPQEIRQPIVGRYEGILEIAGHEILVQVLQDERIGGNAYNFRRKYSDFDAEFRIKGLIHSDSLHEESEEEIKNLKEALQELKAIDICEESKLSLENVKRLI